MAYGGVKAEKLQKPTRAGACVSDVRGRASARRKKTFPEARGKKAFSEKKGKTKRFPERKDKPEKSGAPIKKKRQRLRTVELLMKHGKIYAILIAAAFFVALVCSLVLLFNVKEVEISYSAFGVAEEKAATEALEGLKGKSLLFLNEKEAEEQLAAYPRFKVSKVEKNYPNLLKVSVEERREVYRFFDGKKTFCLDETGFVLEIVSGELSYE